MLLHKRLYHYSRQYNKDNFFKEKIMKKTLVILALLSVMLMVVGCGDDGPRVRPSRPYYTTPTHRPAPPVYRVPPRTHSRPPVIHRSPTPRYTPPVRPPVSTHRPPVSRGPSTHGRPPMPPRSTPGRPSNPSGRDGHRR